VRNPIPKPYRNIFCMSSDRDEATAADNLTNNDTYEYIEGATSNQKKKGRNHNIHLHIYVKLVGNTICKSLHYRRFCFSKYCS
jgi:hypothetical protein